MPLKWLIFSYDLNLVVKEKIQGSLLGLILTHVEAKKVKSCSDSKSFKIYNEGGNAELCVTAFVNKS